MFIINPYSFGGGSWTPADITTGLWLDASDSATITITGGAVSQWDDKSGNGRNAVQGTAANRPVVTSAGQNGLDIITFDGSNDNMSIPYLFANTSASDISVFVAGKRTSGSPGTFMSTRGSGVPNDGNGWTLRTNSTPQLTYFHVGGSPVLNKTCPATGTFYVAEMVRDGLNVYLGVDAAVDAPTAINTFNVVTAGSSYVGAESGGTGSFLNGAIGEIVIVESTVDTTTRQLIEDYLSAKWATA